jgi:hypothetical protein
VGAENWPSLPEGIERKWARKKTARTHPTASLRGNTSSAGKRDPNQI